MKTKLFDLPLGLRWSPLRAVSRRSANTFRPDHCAADPAQEFDADAEARHLKPPPARTRPPAEAPPQPKPTGHYERAHIRAAD